MFQAIVFMLIIAGYISKEKENHNNNQTNLKPKGLKYLSLHEMNILFMKVSVFDLNFEKKLKKKIPRYSHF